MDLDPKPGLNHSPVKSLLGASHHFDYSRLSYLLLSMNTKLPPRQLTLGQSKSLVGTFQNSHFCTFAGHPTTVLCRAMLLRFVDALLLSQCSHHRQQECMQINYFSYPFRVLGLLELLVGGAVSGMVGNADEEETRAWTGEGRAAASSTMLRCSFRNSFRKSDWYVSPFR